MMLGGNLYVKNKTIVKQTRKRPTAQPMRPPFCHFLRFLNQPVKRRIALLPPGILSQRVWVGLVSLRASAQNDTPLRHCEADEASRSNLGDGQEIATLRSQ